MAISESMGSSSCFISVTCSHASHQIFVPSSDSSADLNATLTRDIQNKTKPCCQLLKASIARCRHRRRLARIVVDHWKYMARFRLLLLKARKIHHEKFKRSYFRRWKQYMSQKNIKSRIYHKAQSFNKILVAKRAWLSWIVFIKNCHNIRHASAHLSRFDAKHSQIAAMELYNKLLLRRVIRGWTEYLQLRKHKSQLILKGTINYSNRYRSHTLMAWCDYIYRRKRKKKKRVSVQRHFEVKILAWRKWKLLQKTWKGFLRTETQAIGLRKSHVMISAFSKWKRFLENQQAMKLLKAQAELFLDKCLSKLKSSVLKEMKKLKGANRKEVKGDHGAKPILRARPPPRIPDYLAEDSLNMGEYRPYCRNHSPPKHQTSHIDNYSSSLSLLQRQQQQEAPGNSSLQFYNQKLEGMCISSRCLLDGQPKNREVFTKAVGSLSELKLVSEEIRWMEDLIEGFEELGTEILQKRADLAMLEATNQTSGRGTSGDLMALNFLNQKIAALQRRRAVLLPTIQAISEELHKFHRDRKGLNP